MLQMPSSGGNRACRKPLRRSLDTAGAFGYYPLIPIAAIGHVA